jgi:4-aminobutyrate aminotransferase-like enzyme/Ser/Thr protein kinase RdoA (MazF antagonist)/murein DD-endopeptidase MepM/ murein hydrolase activator NlpD
VVNTVYVNLQYTPRFTLQEAVDLARENYNIQANAETLPSERDQNFLLMSTDGNKYVLKISSAADDRNLLNAQNQALVHLSKSTDLCPKIVNSSNGEPAVEVSKDGSTHLTRVVHYLEGKPLANVKHRSPALLENLGRAIGQLDRALKDFDHPALHRDFYWDLANGLRTIKQYDSLIDDPLVRSLISEVAEDFEKTVLPNLPLLRRSVIHNDANDHNILIDKTNQQIVGILDFGDMVYSYTVCNLAIAIAYAIFNSTNLLQTAAYVIKGYNSVSALTEAELASLFGFVKLRLAMSVCIAANQQKQRPDDKYLSISQNAILNTLPEIEALHRRFAKAMFRNACGLEPVSNSSKVCNWLKQKTFERVIDVDLHPENFLVVDLSVSSPLLKGDPAANEEPELTPRILEEVKNAKVQAAIGRYGEARYLYSSPAFTSGNPLLERRTVHLGIDIFAPAGTKIFAPLHGEVGAFAYNSASHDYGPVIILKHSTDDGIPFYTLYGHLSIESLHGLFVGKEISAGEQIGTLGTQDVNGGWTPHLHIQIITDLLDLKCDFPGVCRASEREVWNSFSPDPNFILKLPLPEKSKKKTLAQRAKVIGPSVRLSYREPVKIVRGWMQYLYDEDGKKYLDAYNNVPHVGHCHPRVVEAAIQQMNLLSTNTRYLHDLIHEYAEKLCGTLPDPLKVFFFVNSGSEANEVAIRLARAYTKRRDMIVLDAAYHGITSTLIDISPYKHNGPGGDGTPSWVHVAPLADPYRNKQSLQTYTKQILEIINRSQNGIAAYLAESCPSVGGQILFPEGYLSNVYDLVRKAGGVCIADEVQTAYGRIGTHFWGFQAQNAVPDIVVLGKPIGNGHPIGAVVTTPEIAASFDNGMEFFSTFGGNTVSCAIGLTVLNVVLEEKLQQHALNIGSHLLQGLRQLQERYPIIGDVRGSGFFIGVELVRNRETLEPATEEASYVMNRMRELGVLLGTDGPYHNVLKIRPPMPFNKSDADLLLMVLDRVLQE